MSYEDIYREFLVTEAEVRTDEVQTIFHCNLLGRHNHRVSFQLIISGCVGEAGYQAQYEAIKPLCTVGTLLHCSIVYRHRYDAFVMCIGDMMALQAIRMNDGSTISGEAYLDPNRGYWVQTESASEWAQFPGVIELDGESHIPARPFPLLLQRPDSERSHELALVPATPWYTRLWRRLLPS